MKALALSVALAVTGPGAAQAPETESLFEKFEFRIPMRDGIRLYTAVYVPRDASARYPILLYRTRYGVEHYGANDYAPRRDLGAGRSSTIHPTSSSSRTSGELSLGGQVRPHDAAPDAKGGPEGRRREHRHLGHHRLAGEERPPEQRQESASGESPTGFFAAAGMIDAHPALKAVSPQAPQADWFMGDDIRHNGASGPRTLRVLHPPAGARAGSPPRRRRGFRLRHEGRLQVLSRAWGRSRTPTSGISRDQIQRWTDFHGARDLR